jgi:hypothetical protein
MARPNSTRGEGSGEKDKLSRQDARLADISTAASSSMEPKDFSQGYGPNGGEMLNMNFSGKTPKGSKS